MDNYDPESDLMRYEPRDRIEPSYKRQIVIKPDETGYSIEVYNVDGKLAGSGLDHRSVENYNDAIKSANYFYLKYHFPIVDLTKESVKENKNMNREKFQNIIRECLSEVKAENDPRIKLKESLRPLIKKVLSEIANVSTPPITKEEEETVNKGYFKKGNERIDKVNNKLADELEKIVHAINPDWHVYWDDHTQLVVEAKNMLKIRICPKFENNFDIDAMVKLVDRVRAIALTWDQVKAFVKANFSDLENKTIPDKMKDRAMDQIKDKDKDSKDAGPRHDIIKNRLEDPEHTKIKDSKRDDKDYNEKQTPKEEDQPNQPMKQVVKNPGDDPESLNKNIEKTPQVKPPKHKNDKKLVTKLIKTKKFNGKTL